MNNAENNRLARRDAKINRKKNGMRVSGKSIFLAERIVSRKSEAAHRNRANRAERSQAYA